MAEIKTKVSDQSVSDFIHSFADTEQKRNDSFKLIKIMEKVTGCEAKMWGASIIGFGSYHYKSERSAQKGDWPLVGFSPRKAAISLYVYSDTPEQKVLLDTLGKYKMGKSCIYIKKLSDINETVLQSMMLATIQFLKNKYD